MEEKHMKTLMKSVKAVKISGKDMYNAYIKRVPYMNGMYSYYGKGDDFLPKVISFFNIECNVLFCTEKQLNYFKKNIDCPLADLKNFKKYANLMGYAEKQYICEDIEEIFYLTPEGDWRLVQVTEDGLKEYLFDNIDPAEVSAEEMYNAYYNSHLDITVKPELTYKESHLLPCIQLFEDNTKILYCFRDQLDEIKNTDLPLENISLESLFVLGSSLNEPGDIYFNDINEVMMYSDGEWDLMLKF